MTFVTAFRRSVHVFLSDELASYRLAAAARRLVQMNSVTTAGRTGSMAFANVDPGVERDGELKIPSELMERGGEELESIEEERCDLCSGESEGELLPLSADIATRARRRCPGCTLRLPIIGESQSSSSDISVD